MDIKRFVNADSRMVVNVGVRVRLGGLEWRKLPVPPKRREVGGPLGTRY